MRIILLLILTVLTVPQSFALTFARNYLNFQIKPDAGTDTMTLSWFGQKGFTYFLQNSEDLKNWSYIPLIEAGHDEEISYGFTLGASAMFFRLRIFDAAASSGPWINDSDGDGIPDYLEILQGFDPFDSSDGADQFNSYQRQVSSLGKAPETANALGLLVYTP